MKKIFTILVVTLFVQMQCFAWKPLFAGHRGSYRGVENTEEAFMNAINYYGYTGMEIDVKTTSDGHCVCWHDDKLDRVGHADVSIPNSTLAELQALTLTQTRGGVQYTGKICTVDRFLEICKTYNMFPIIELKWAVGINNSDMHLFPSLYALIQKHGLVDKAIILTSMQKSLEYVRTNYPALKCQFLSFNELSNTQFEWCKKWGINPSVQIKGISKSFAKKCHDAGLQVATWSVNDKSIYIQHGDLGCYMMTCDYLIPSAMPEIEDIDWESMVPVEPLDQVYVTELFRRSSSSNNLPTNFPTTKEGKYKQAQQAAYINGTFYAADYSAQKVIAIDTTGLLTETNMTTPRHGICRDDAGNLILNTSSTASTPNQLTIYKAGDNSGQTISFTLNHVGQTNFPTASGDIFSSTGGYVYFFPNKQKFVEIVKIMNGQYVSTTSAPVSLEGTTASYVIPINNNPNHFVYQVRTQGFNLYKDGDKGAYGAISSSTTAPNRNSTVGGAIFTLSDHELFVHPSGSNYNGGWTLRDMSSSRCSALYTQEPLGSSGYNGNASVGEFFYFEKIDSVTVNLYEYCLGNGIAAWEIRSQPRIIAVESLALEETEIEMMVGDTIELHATISPKNATNQTVSFRADHARSVKVKGMGTYAIITSNTEGDYVITATLDNFQATCNLHVKVPTALENPTNAPTISKRFINGVIVIENNGEYFDIIGNPIQP